MSAKSITADATQRVVFRVEVAFVFKELAGKLSEVKELLACRKMNFRLAGNGPETYRTVNLHFGLAGIAQRQRRRVWRLSAQPRVLSSGGFGSKLQELPD